MIPRLKFSSCQGKRSAFDEVETKEEVRCRVWLSAVAACTIDIILYNIGICMYECTSMVCMVCMVMYGSIFGRLEKKWQVEGRMATA